MLRRVILVGLLTCALVGSALAQTAKDLLLLNSGAPSLSLNFLAGSLDPRITFTRASTATSGLYTDASGSSYTSYTTGLPRFFAGKGLLIEEQRTNSLLNSDAPATQTVTLGTGGFTLWVIGTGSAAVVVGTAICTGVGTATPGVPDTFNCSVGGTVVLTVTGTLTRFQLENGAFATSYIPTVGSTATRAADIATMPLGPWFNPAAGTFVFKGLGPVGAGVNQGNLELFGFGDGTPANVITTRFQTTANFVTTSVFVGNSNKGGPSSIPAITAGAQLKAALSYNSPSLGLSLALNGAIPVASPATAFPTFTTLGIGGGGGGRGGPMNTTVASLQYYPRALSASQLQQVTQ